MCSYGYFIARHVFWRSISFADSIIKEVSRGMDRSCHYKFLINWKDFNYSINHVINREPLMLLNNFKGFFETRNLTLLYRIHNYERYKLEIKTKIHIFNHSSCVVPTKNKHYWLIKMQFLKCLLMISIPIYIIYTYIKKKVFSPKMMIFIKDKILKRHNARFFFANDTSAVIL